MDETTVRRILQAGFPPHFEELLPDALDGLPPGCVAIADTLREELVFANWTDVERDLLKRHHPARRRPPHGDHHRGPAHDHGSR